MKRLTKLMNYIYERELNLIYNHKKLNVINYTAIVHFADHQIKLEHETGMVFINGEQLVITKLFNHELLISGEIKSIEFR